MADDRAALDDAYANAPYIAGADEFPERWAREAAAARAELGALDRAEIGVPYGPTRRQVYDLFLPAGEPTGLVVFVHGGYWRAFDSSSWSHLAFGPLSRGAAVAMPSYDLCPQVRIADIPRQIAAAIVAVAARVDGPITLTGHSAGGHLGARMLAPGVLAEPVARRIVCVVPISPLADLRPLRRTSMNDDFGLDGDSAAAESPVLQPPPAVPVTVWVGGEERPAFLDQARALAAAWSCELVVVDGRHHFDVIGALGDPASRLVRLLDPANDGAGA